MLKYLHSIPRNLNSSNIQDAIAEYRRILAEFPCEVKGGNPLEFLTKIKREKVGIAPYPNVSFFEAANRILTDLTILLGVQELLKGNLSGVHFEEYKIELGIENNNKYDITAHNDRQELIGEGFNVSESLFQGKKAKTLKKLREPENDNKIKLLVYNNSAVSDSYLPKRKTNEFHLKVDVDHLWNW